MHSFACIPSNIEIAGWLRLFQPYVPTVDGSACSINYSRDVTEKFCSHIFPSAQKTIFVKQFSIHLQITSSKAQYKCWKIWEIVYLCSQLHYDYHILLSCVLFVILSPVLTSGTRNFTVNRQRNYNCIATNLNPNVDG